MSLIDILNLHKDKTPDEIAKAVGDPLSSWQSLTTFVTPDNYTSIQDRDVMLFEFDRGIPTINYDAMTSQYSYRTLDPAYAQRDNLGNYDPFDAQSMENYWVIGWEYRMTPVPTHAPDPAHDTWPDPYDEEDEYEPDE